MTTVGGGQKLRITHVITTPNFAGTERYVVEVSRGLVALGHEVNVIGGAPDTMGKLVQAPVQWRPGGTAGETLRSLLAGGRRDIVHTHIAKSDFVAVMAALVTGGKRVSTRHITAPRGYSRLARLLGRPVRALLAREIAVSAWTAAQLRPPADCVLLNGVPIVPDADGERENVVLVAQRLAPEKDTDTAIRAWQRSGLAQHGWRMAVAGEGAERAALQELVEELGVGASVEFLGWLADPGERLRTAGIFLAPAPNEPCGLTVLEAMAQGLPVVAAGAGGHLETVGRSAHAALFAPGDIGGAAQLLVGLAQDATARQDYGHALRHLQRTQFNVEEHVNRLEQIYFDVGRSPD